MKANNRRRISYIGHLLVPLWLVWLGLPLSEGWMPLSSTRPRPRLTTSMNWTRHSVIAKTYRPSSTRLLLSPGTLSMAALAAQFAAQPILTRRFVGDSVRKTTYVAAQDVLRVVLCAAILTSTDSWPPQAWAAPLSTLAAVGLPAALYVGQNYCSLLAYQQLSPILYNVLNQTKTLSAALWCYLLLGQPQSTWQCLALAILILGAVVMQPLANNNTKDSTTTGLVAILAASGISGLAGAWTQKTLRHKSANAVLFSLQLALCSLTLLTTSLTIQSLWRTRPDELNGGLWNGWTWRTWIPLSTNAAGGILVGLVTKYAGVVEKGFALILGLFLSGLLQNAFEDDHPVTGRQWLGGVLAAVSLWMHAAYPPAVNRVQ